MSDFIAASFLKPLRKVSKTTIATSYGYSKVRTERPHRCGESNLALNLRNSKQLPISAQSQELYKKRTFEASKADNKKFNEVQTQRNRKKKKL